MLHCKEATGTIVRGEFEEAGWTRRLAVRFHLLMCRHCQIYVTQIKKIGQSVRQLFTLTKDEEARLEALEETIYRRAFGDEPGGGAPRKNH